ncbi:PepSY-like domain-containing protein [Aridibaculum aurantiacum]|uniref:PepSY-like domain-containing protein n=1 Tax=Aridibaculum aurantiacum TaxID=2810307 RepID=UPI001A9769D1|nr:PepSY-like domain-containing protein [Aridibaculum aurantiacum]
MTLLMLASVYMASAQFRKLPAEVTDSFKVKFPTATQVSWRDRLNSFQAEFKEQGQPVKANFASNGEWLKTEKRYNYELLPAAVKDGFKKSKYAEWLIKEVVETHDKKDGQEYRITVRKGDFSKRYLRFSVAGQLLDDSLTL